MDKDYLITFRFAGDYTERKELVSEINAERAWERLQSRYGNPMQSSLLILLDTRVLSNSKVEE